MHRNVSAKNPSYKGGAPVRTDISYYQKPRITVVTVVFNGSETLERTILSVIGQTYKNIQYIIIDGGSTDSTLDIIRKYEHAIDRWVSEPDGGIYDAMNKGVRYASGNWINFMNGGDEFAGPGVLSGLADRLVDSLDLIYGDVEVQNKDLCVTVKPSSRNNHIPIRGMLACHQSIVFRTEWFRRYPYNLDYDLAADFDSLCHILGNGGKAEKVPPVIARVNTKGVSRNNRLEVYRQYEKIYNSYYGRDLFSAWYYSKRRILVRLKSLISRCWPSVTHNER